MVHFNVQLQVRLIFTFKPLLYIRNNLRAPKKKIKRKVTVFSLLQLEFFCDFRSIIPSVYFIVNKSFVQKLVRWYNDLTDWPILYFLPDSWEISCPPGQESLFSPPLGIGPHIGLFCKDFPLANHSMLYVTFCHISIPLRMSTLQIKVTFTYSSSSLKVITGWPRSSLENGCGGSSQTQKRKIVKNQCPV